MLKQITKEERLEVQLANDHIREITRRCVGPEMYIINSSCDSITISLAIMRAEDRLVEKGNHCA